jgi:hypothetical protein
MKQFRLCLALAVVALAAFGCSKTPTEQTTTPANSAVTQQTYAASTGQGMADVCDNGISDFSGYLSGFKKNPDKSVYDSSYWWGPYSGWYYLYWNNTGIIYPDSAGSDTTTYTWLWRIKFTPSPVAPDTVEWYWTYHDTTAAYFLYHGQIMHDGDIQHIKGSWNYGIYTPANYDYTWSFTFDSVSVATNDYQGHYTFTCNYWPCVTGTGYQLVTLTGDYRFNVDGSGTGTLYADGAEIVRYVFYAMSASTRGYYTLAAESWGTQHGFGSK